MEQIHWTFWTSSVLHVSLVSNSTLTESRQDDLLPLGARHIRVMPGVRFDDTGHVIMK